MIHFDYLKVESFYKFSLVFCCLPAKLVNHKSYMRTRKMKGPWAYSCYIGRSARANGQLSCLHSLKYFDLRSHHIYRVVCQWWIIWKPLESCWKPAGNLRGRFPAGFQPVSGFWKRNHACKKFGNPLKTCWKPAGEVSRGFRQVLDNSPLMDHAAYLKLNEIIWGTSWCTPSPRVTRILVPGKNRVMRKPC